MLSTITLALEKKNHVLLKYESFFQKGIHVLRETVIQMD